MFKWFAKKFVLGKVNTILAGIKNGDSVASVCDKAERVAALAQEIAAAAKDRKITDEEAAAILARAEELFA